MTELLGRIRGQRRPLLVFALDGDELIRVADRGTLLRACSACPADRVPVIRLYNNGKGGQANHRYSTSHSEIGDMLGQGWIIEGPVFCGLP